tara:strand:+ start:1117 stop:1242 length:126 start_codon:yes stop_codon:yes gene_type:complete
MLKNIIEITKFVFSVGAMFAIFYGLYIIMWAMSPENGLGLY